MTIQQEIERFLRENEVTVFPPAPAMGDIVMFSSGRRAPRKQKSTKRTVKYNASALEIEKTGDRK